MIIDDYAQLEQKTGSRLIKKGGAWWREVRPLFYRPLLPFQLFHREDILRCFRPWQTVQFGVKDTSLANSQLHMIVFDDIQSYQLDTLDTNRRRNIRQAIRNGISIRQIHDPVPFIPRAFPVYQSFCQRTHYAFQKNRKQINVFSNWLHTLLDFPDMYLLGAYHKHELIAIEICCIVDRILIGKSMISSGKSIQLRAPDLIYHYLREEIAKKQHVRLIFMGMVCRESGINKFKLWRGAKLLSVPAHLSMLFPAKWILKQFRKSEYDFLTGELPI